MYFLPVTRFNRKYLCILTKRKSSRVQYWSTLYIIYIFSWSASSSRWTTSGQYWNMIEHETETRQTQRTLSRSVNNFIIISHSSQRNIRKTITPVINNKVDFVNQSVEFTYTFLAISFSAKYSGFMFYRLDFHEFEV